MRDLILELAQRHLPDAKLVTRVFQDGFRHVAYEIDGTSVLKVARAGTLPEELRVESALLQALDGAKLPIPRLIAFDDGPPPFMLSTRVPGTQLSHLPQPWQTGLVKSVARGLATIHQTPLSPSIRAIVDEMDVARRWEGGIEELQTEGFLSDEQAYVLNRMLDDNWPRFSATPLVLTHSDFWPHHCIVSASAELSGFIDFADATLAAPAWDLSFPWMTFFGIGRERIVAAYKEQNGLGPEFLEEVEFYSVFWALRMPRWAREHNLGFRDGRTALSVLKHFFSRHETGSRRVY